jgi:hypothetical protein
MLKAPMGRSQVVRQRILIPPFPGSNPGAPARPVAADTHEAPPCRLPHRKAVPTHGRADILVGC